MAHREFDVVGIGNAIVDVLAHVDEEFLAREEVVKGSMTLIDDTRAERLTTALGDTTQCSGGSAANTMAGLASFGSSAAYIGKVANDTLGESFRRGMADAGVLFKAPSLVGGPGSGRCLVLVTDDAQRTMLTYLGASALVGPDDVDKELIESGYVTYLEGYLFDSPEAKRAFVRAAEIAHAAGRRTALTLSDSFCVHRHRESFRELVRGHIDILFANEDEIVALYEANDFDEAARTVRDECGIAALTKGAEGAVVVAGDQHLEVPAAPVARVIDTTGAGDLFAAGFLHGLCRGDELERATRYGAVAAAEVISHYGARPEHSLSELAKEI